MAETTLDDVYTFSIGMTGRFILDANELASVLRNLSADYRRVTGGRLNVVRYEMGSAWIHVQDALVLAGAVATQVSDLAVAGERMLKFAGAVKTFFQKDEPTIFPSDTGKLVAKSMTKLTELATKKGAGLELDYKRNSKSGDESITLKITPADVNLKHLELIMPLEATSIKGLRGSSPTELTANPPPSVPRVLLDFNEVGSGSLTDLEAIVASIVHAHVATGDASALPLIADQLDGEGRHEIASMIRKHLRPPPSISRPIET